ncbi:MAG: PDZ domain-containing protein [Planctomycetes bacterium]|nr:PDZ domain-containing protein [Planctomycetota bacterium]
MFQRISLSVVFGLVAAMGLRGQQQKCVEVSLDVDGKTVKVLVRGTEVSCKVNGEDLPADAVKTKVFDVAMNTSADQILRARLLAPSSKAKLGVTVASPEPTLSHQLGIDPACSLVVTGVEESGAAKQAGVRPHDVIVMLDEDRVVTVDRLRECLISKKPGDSLTLEVIRQHGPERIEVVLGEKAATPVEVETKRSDPSVIRWLDVTNGDPAKEGVEHIIHDSEGRESRVLLVPELNVGQWVVESKPATAERWTTAWLTVPPATTSSIEESLDQISRQVTTAWSTLPPAAKPSIEERLDQISSRLDQLAKMIEKLGKSHR